MDTRSNDSNIRSDLFHIRSFTLLTFLWVEFGKYSGRTEIATRFLCISFLFSYSFVFIFIFFCFRSLSFFLTFYCTEKNKTKTLKRKEKAKQNKNTWVEFYPDWSMSKIVYAYLWIKSLNSKISCRHFFLSVKNIASGRHLNWMASLALIQGEITLLLLRICANIPSHSISFFFILPILVCIILCFSYPKVSVEQRRHYRKHLRSCGAHTRRRATSKQKPQLRVLAINCSVYGLGWVTVLFHNIVAIVWTKLFCAELRENSKG